MATPFGIPGGTGYIDPFAPKPITAPAPSTTLAQDQAKAANQGKPGFDVFGNPVQTTPPSSTVPSNSYTGPINNSINNTQQGADLVNANKAQAAKMGITIPGSTYNPSTSSDTSASTTSNSDLDTLKKAQDARMAEWDQVGNTAMTAIENIQNGVTPLTSGEQAQIDGLKAQFQTMIDQQTKINTQAEGTAQMRGAQGGAMEYDPLFQAKTIASVVSAGQAKIADLQSREAAAVASLTQSFKDNDIAAVKDAWDIYQQTAEKTNAYFQKVIDDTQQAIKDAQDQQMKVQQYNLDVDKFQQTQDQNAFDNAFKVEQEKFNEQNKTATLKLEQFKAGLGAGGGGLAITQSAQMGPNGVDPASQKQVLDQISQTYGPMTAIAIKGLTDYSLNPSDWSTRMVKGGQGMTREQAVTLAKMVDPTYSDAMYPTRAAYIKNLSSSQTGTIGSAINAANKSINHLTAYVNTMATVGNKVSTAVNAIANFVETNPQRRQAINAATTEGLGVAEELAKFFKGSGTVDVASIDAWKSRISPNATPADVQGNTQGAITLLAGQLETLSEQYAATMGHPPPANFLGPSAMANLSQLKNEGYTVDVPGVYYTDKAAYMRNDPNAQENMKIAVQQLQAAGLPMTPDNILQLAQQE